MMKLNFILLSFFLLLVSSEAFQRISSSSLKSFKLYAKAKAAAAKPKSTTTKAVSTANKNAEDEKKDVDYIFYIFK
jgi:hypothetical protein